MKVLWIVSTATNFNQSVEHFYNGCGWIASLQNNLERKTDLELGIAFYTRHQENFKVIRNRTVYYPILDEVISRRDVLTSFFHSAKEQDKRRIDKLVPVIKDFCPNIIQVFGTEGFYGLITYKTSVPVVIHIQGVVNACYNSFLPPFMSWKEYPSIALNLRHRILRHFDKKDWLYKSEREIEIFKGAKYFLGRTDWDQMITRLFNPNAQYFECWEVLRETFYDTSSIRIIPDKLRLVSILSNVSYKGYDVILKAAYFLNNIAKVSFEWKVYGGVNSKAFEDITGISAYDNNIELCGVAQAEEIKEDLLKCTAMVHPSYIDNSSNSVCEAMLLGCPVIASRVGGLTSLLEDGETGFLFPANDIYTLSNHILALYKDSKLNTRIGNNAKIVAQKRHTPNNIVNNLYNIYKMIVNNNNYEV